MMKLVKQDYEKKFGHDKKRMDKIEMLSMGSSPMGILKSLINWDDHRKYNLKPE